eukprot:Gb_09248 [translate_table: standard]
MHTFTQWFVGPLSSSVLGIFAHMHLCGEVAQYTAHLPGSSHNKSHVLPFTYRLLVSSFAQVLAVPLVEESGVGWCPFKYSGFETIDLDKTSGKSGRITDRNLVALATIECLVAKISQFQGVWAEASCLHGGPTLLSAFLGLARHRRRRGLATSKREEGLRSFASSVGPNISCSWVCVEVATSTIRGSSNGIFSWLCFDPCLVRRSCNGPYYDIELADSV